MRVSPEMGETPSHAMAMSLSPSRIASSNAVSREESGDGEAVGEIAPAIMWQHRLR